MNKNLNLNNFRFQQKLILIKLHWYQIKDINTLAINKIFANW